MIKYFEITFVASITGILILLGLDLVPIKTSLVMIILLILLLMFLKKEKNAELVLSFLGLNVKLGFNTPTGTVPTEPRTEDDLIETEEYELEGGENGAV